MNPLFSLHDYPYCGVSHVMAKVYHWVVVVYPHEQLMMYFCVNYTIRLGVLIPCIVSSYEGWNYPKDMTIADNHVPSTLVLVRSTKYNYENACAYIYLSPSFISAQYLYLSTEVCTCKYLNTCNASTLTLF